MLANAVPKLKNGLTHREERQQRKADDETALRRCYAAVDRRDGKVCRVSGLPLSADAPDSRRRLCRHHMRPRSTAPCERHSPANVITISQWISDQIHVKAAIFLEGDAGLRDAEGRFCGVTLSQATEYGWREVRTL